MRSARGLVRWETAVHGHLHVHVVVHVRTMAEQSSIHYEQKITINNPVLILYTSSTFIYFFEYRQLNDIYTKHFYTLVCI